MQYRSGVRPIAGMVISGAVVFALTACGSDDGGDGPSASAADQSTATSSADPATAQSMVLPAAGFPSGFEVQEVPASQVQTMADQILDATKNAKISPASCAQLSLLPEKVDTGEVGLAVATSGTSTLGTAVTAEPAKLDQVRASMSGECEHLSMDITSGPAAGATATVDQKVVKAPATDADEAIVVEQTTETTVSGATSETKALLGLASVDGYTVTAQYTSLTGGELDRELFDEFFTAVVDHAAGTD